VVKENNFNNPRLQQGGALILFVLALVLAGVAALFVALDGNDIKIERDKKTVVALAEAKAALMGFSARSGTSVGASRPGDLPCPDTDNDGSADACAGNAIGRLPWFTLGVSDLRDGDNERLWYAVSVNFKNNPRLFPLNSDTLGTITLRDTSGVIINDGSLNDGLVAVVFSPGVAIERQDAVNQVRDDAVNQNNPINYLDVALGEDNQNFINSNTNGFIKGPIKAANGAVILNDHLISITQSELIALVEQRVVAEVSNALLDFYCGLGNADYGTKTCAGAGGERFFPRPALFSNDKCLGLGNITSDCNSNVAANHGRIPVDISLPASPALAWTATSILRGTSVSNWFQRNGWREQIHYAVAPACVDGTVDCGGAGFLTLNFALTNPVNNKRVIVTAAGSAQLAQVRADSADKKNEANYLENENLLPLDDIYTRAVAAGIIFNDRSVNIP